LAHQGREFLPGKFTGIDRMTISGGGQDISGTGFRSPVEVILAPCQKPVVSQFEISAMGIPSSRLNDASAPKADIERLTRFCIFLRKLCRAEGSKLGLTDQFLEVSRPRNHIEMSGGEDWIRVQILF
jgi:hypothetical protein